jgi:IclR family mhp operon transcriptional activator
MAAYDPVRAVVRGLQVLREISERGPIGASDVAARLSLPQASVVRAIETLEAEGYVSRKSSTALFVVTGRTTALSRGFDARNRLIDLTQPVMERLRHQIGWPSNIGIFDQDAMLIAYTNRDSHAFSVPGRYGARVPMLVTGIGLAYLAFVTPEARLAILKRLQRSQDPWDSNRRFSRNLEARLGTIRNQGYALADEDYLDAIYHSRIWAIAVPVVVDTAVHACISALVLRSKTSSRRAASSLREPLRAAAAEIGKLLARESGA